MLSTCENIKLKRYQFIIWSFLNFFKSGSESEVIIKASDSVESHISEEERHDGVKEKVFES